MTRRIVMVVDEMKNISSIANITRNDLEGNSAEQTLRLKASLQTIAPVICYTNVAEFEIHINEHLNDIVFPMYYGIAGLNAKGMVPVLCELHHIPYVGADAYTQILCNDKSLSKQYSANFGVASPQGCLLRTTGWNQFTYERLTKLRLPLVVKPNFGGGSTGISVNSIVHSYEEGIALSENLLQNFQIPILIEEYMEGYEVELIVAGAKGNIRFCEEVQLLMDGKSYFDHDIWGFETKEIDDSSIEFCMSNHISEADRQKLQSLFHSFEKAEMMRFDGRVQNGRFYLIELSPDCYLGDDCAFYYAFQNKGYTHPQMFRFLIENALGLG